MSGPDDAANPEIPEEFAATYAEAYRRALEEGQYDELNTGIHPIVVDDQEAGRLIHEVEPQVAGQAGTHRSAPAGPAPDLRRYLVPGVIGLAAVLLVLAAYGLGKVIGGGDEPSTRPTSAPVPTGPTNGPGATKSARPTEGAYRGRVEAVVPARARASCRAPDGTDSSGDPVNYRAQNAIDDDPATAWRCNGDGVGVTLRFRFDDKIRIAEVGLIPGYAKTDQSSNADRYAENNRITRVRWVLGDGTTVEQKLDPAPKNRAVQTLRVPATTTDDVRLEILAVEKGPRNTTAISTVVFASAAD